MGGERGQALPLVAVLTVVLLGMMGLAIDVGYALSVRQALQASTDAAATAAAMELSEAGGGSPTTVASQFAMTTGSKNARSTITGVSIQTTVKCTNYMANLMTGANCTSPSTPANTVTVVQRAPVATFFGRVLGFTSFDVGTRATAGMRGGSMPPLDVMIVLDTTASMGGNCSASVAGVTHPTRLDCAKAGIRTLLNALWPCSQTQATCGAAVSGHVANPIDEVGLAVFPGLKAATPLSRQFDCSRNLASGDVSPYGASPVYVIAPLASDYKPSATGALAGASSNMVKAVDWGNGNTCSSTSYGAENPGGQGSYFAGAIQSAQSALQSSGRPTVQNVIIFVSDGDANRYTGGPANPCRLAITAAQAAAAAGTWVYSVAYGASTSSSGSCANDSPRISAYDTMRQIASDSSKFFSQPSSGDLTAAFKQIGQSLLTTRLLDDSTM
ncbi:MAG: pilus assembly protein TadG-related protein [Vicinamibacterales bacterium]